MRTNLFIKVVVEHEEKEPPEKLGIELCRQLERNYIVRQAELSNYSERWKSLKDRVVEAQEIAVRHPGDEIADGPCYGDYPAGSPPADFLRMRQQVFEQLVEFCDRIRAGRFPEHRKNRRCGAGIASAARLVCARFRGEPRAAAPDAAAPLRCQLLPAAFTAATVPLINPETRSSIRCRTDSWNCSRSVAPGNCVSMVSRSSAYAGTASAIRGGRQQARLVGVVEVGRVVCHFIRQIDQLRFERRPQSRQIFVELGKLPRSEIARVLDDSFAHFEGQVQSRKPRVALLQRSPRFAEPGCCDRSARRSSASAGRAPLRPRARTADDPRRAPAPALRSGPRSARARWRRCGRSAKPPAYGSGGCGNDRRCPARIPASCFPDAGTRGCG